MRATLCAGAVHTLPVLHSALGSVGSISQIQKLRRKGPRARESCSWTAGGLFCFAPSRRNGGGAGFPLPWRPA